MSSDLGFYLPSFRIGGAERVIINLANEFSNRGYRVDVVVRDNTGRLQTEVADSVHILQTASVPFPPYQCLGDVPYLRQYFQNRNPDYFYSAMNHVNIPILVARWIAAGSTEVIVGEHNDPSLLWQHSWKDRLVYRVGKYIYPTANSVVAVSEGVANSLSSIIGMSENDIKVIYNPIVTDRIERQRRQPTNHEWFESDKFEVILGVGRLSEQKRFVDLVEAFAQIEHTSNSKLVIIGKGPQQSKIKQKIQSHGLSSEAELLGHVDNIYAYMNGASAFALSSGWEGFGNVIVEAFACGCPVVSTDCPSGPAEILQQGKYGKLVPVGDTEAMATAIQAILTSDTDEDQLLERAADFHVETITDQYEELLFGKGMNSKPPHRRSA